MATVFDFCARLLAEMWALCVAMAPWLFIGFLAAGALGALIPAAFVRRHLAGRGWKRIFKAVLIGVPLPICSCGVIPLAAELRKAGASKGAVAAFTATTPQTGVDSIAATYALMGLPFTVARVATDLIAGFLAGGLINACDRDDAAGATDAAPAECPKCRAAREAREREAMGSWRTRGVAALKEALFGLPADIGKYVAFGIFIGALIGIVFPQEGLDRYLSAPWQQYLAVSLVAIPMYVCSTGAIPIAFGLVAAGFSPGAAIVFLSLGPATNAVTIAVFWKLLGRRDTVLYVGSLALAAWGMGFACDALGLAVPAAPEACMGHAASWWRQALAALLIFVTVFAVVRKRLSERGAAR